MKNKIAYFMDKDTRLILDNLTKVIIDENEVFVTYTVQRILKDVKIAVVNYIKNENLMVIYDRLKKYNSNVYEAFIEWANEKDIEWYSVKEVNYGI